MLAFLAGLRGLLSLMHSPQTWISIPPKCFLAWTELSFYGGPAAWGAALMRLRFSLGSWLPAVYLLSGWCGLPPRWECCIFYGSLFLGFLCGFGGYERVSALFPWFTFLVQWGFVPELILCTHLMWQCMEKFMLDNMAQSWTDHICECNFVLHYPWKQ